MAQHAGAAERQVAVGDDLGPPADEPPDDRTERARVDVVGADHVQARPEVGDDPADVVDQELVRDRARVEHRVVDLEPLVVRAVDEGRAVRAEGGSHRDTARR